MTLNDKIVIARYKRFEDKMIPVRYIKEFIKDLKEELSGWDLHRGMSDSKCHNIIDELAGSEFVQDANKLEVEE